MYLCYVECTREKNGEEEDDDDDEDEKDGWWDRMLPLATLVVYEN